MEANGHHKADIKELFHQQEKAFSNLEQILNDGFHSLASEMRLIREALIGPATNKDLMSIDAHNKIINGLENIIKPIFKGLCAVIVILVIWLTGLKHLAPHIFTP